MTALAEPDLTLGDDDRITNWICMLAAKCADGTLLFPTTFHQEDMVAMCEGLGWKHPEGLAVAHSDGNGSNIFRVTP